ncbi:hypothetical protein KY290_012734 [Solanum tuberosum]|uniref:Uncharacterized protein n=1 Tax=Solanum tuberosum TaxID=4113 RepID=A0ABQ7VJV5_SOLTU|nr:hypothetical protein KY285_012609 [Solanum tuberosum]KAH0768753.1 hypothetical protein KY290_012734 [Solanum tuberosum]
MGVYTGQYVGQGVQAKQAAPMSAMTWGAPKGLACRQRPRTARKSEGYNPLYDYENGMKLHGGVKEVKTSNYYQTTPNLEVGSAVNGPL